MSVRNSVGQFTRSLWAKFVHVVKVVLVWSVVLSVIGGGIYVYASSKYVDKITMPAPETYEQFHAKKVEEYKQTPEFQAERAKALAETEDQLNKLADLRITNAVLTRIEQSK